MMNSMIERFGPLLSPEGVGSGGTASPAPSGASPASGSAPTDSGGGDSGGSSPTAPAATPATPSSSPPGGGEASFDFGAMFGDFDGDSSAAKLVGSEAAPVEPTPPPASPPQPPVTETPQVVPAAQPAAEVKVEAASAPTVAAAPDAGGPPTLDPYDPVALGTQLAQHEAQATQFVAEQMFQLSPEEREAIESDVIGTIPKLLAKVFVKSQQNVLSQLGRMIPVMIQRQTEAMQKNLDGMNKFYGAWPAIDKAKHGDLVTKYASVYRQMHPTATLDQMIQDLGPMIMMAGRIVPPVAQPPARQGTPPAAPNGRPPQPSPFVPAGAGPVSSPKTVEMEPWEAMFRQ